MRGIRRGGIDMKPVALKAELSTILLVGIVLSGCMQATDFEEGMTVEAQLALESENKLSMNAIDLNGLISSAIDLNGIDPEMLSTGVLAALQDNGQLGENTRILYRYLISCALNPGQSISFLWTDTSSVVHHEVFWGSLGLAPLWKYLPISASGRRLVSACIAARANYFGTPVSISIRGPHPTIEYVSPAEAAAYPSEEGAFWGDLFDGAPQLYSCHNSANIAHSRTKLRDCAAGHYVDEETVAECAYITIVGDCDSVCDPLDPSDLHRPRCDDDEIGTPTTEVVTVFLEQ